MTNPATPNQLKSHRFALRSAQAYFFILTPLSCSACLLAGFNRADLLYPTLKNYLIPHLGIILLITSALLLIKYLKVPDCILP